MQPKLRVTSSGHGGSGYKHPLTGQVVPGVTTILKKLDKPALIQWAVDNTAAYAVANIDSLLSRTEEEGYGFLRWYWKRDPLKGDQNDIRNYSNGVLNDAAELGTMFHDYIAAEHGLGWFPDTRNAPDHFWELVDQWEELKKQHKIEPIHTEVTFWNNAEGYAGTADGVWMIDGVPCLIDVKTSRNTWDEHRMQLVALGACDTMLVERDGEWVEEAMPAFSAYKMIHIRPSDTDKNGAPMDGFAKIVDIPHEETDALFDQFLGLLKVSHAQNTLKKVRKNSVVDSAQEEE